MSGDNKMTAFTNYAETQLINHIFRTASFTKPTTLNLALFTAVGDGEAATVTELTGNGYTRVACNPLDANWSAPVSGNGTTYNVNTITFPAATADWGTITHFGIYDASTAGNLLIYAPLTIARNITNGSTPSFAATALTFQVDN
jgi:hypothetical protein